MTTVLGISAYYHDAAACVLRDGEIVAAAQEERFSRKKHDASFPTQAVKYCLAEAGIDKKIDAVAFYDKPLIKFHRILETHLSTAPSGFKQFVRSMPTWMREKLWIPPDIEKSLDSCGIEEIGEMYFPEHHESHAASAFFPSPFDEAAIMTMDGVGEWACSTLGQGEGSKLEILCDQSFPHSLGLLYSAFTYYLGFKVNSGEYKVMGLAPYGEGKYTRRILDEMMDLKPDGSFRLNMDYFGYLDDLVMTNERFANFFGAPNRSSETEIDRHTMDVAKSVQEVTEEIVLRTARTARERTGKSNLCMAGGVALNCVANGRLARENIFDDIWVQPAATDAGGALGAAMAVWYGELGNERPKSAGDSMKSSLLGPSFSHAQITEYLDANDIGYEELSDADWASRVAALIADEKVIGLFQGRMEFGPRALGNRSIIGDPRSETMQTTINLKIKFRESFRPFAPSVLEERMREYFDIEDPSPYMLMVAPVKESLREANHGDEKDLPIHEWVSRKRSSLPAITHVDYSARIQSVTAETNPRYYELIKAFEALTGCGALINTSFNVRGEPVVCSPSDAYQCFMRTQMDYLILGNCLLDKSAQSSLATDQSWHDVVSEG